MRILCLQTHFSTDSRPIGVRSTFAMASSMTPRPNPPTSFTVAFERLRDSISKTDAQSFASTTLEDVWTTAKEIERYLQQRRSLRSFRRMEPFLKGIEQYSRIIEVLCQGTPYLPYIWVSRVTRIKKSADFPYRHQSNYSSRSVKFLHVRAMDPTIHCFPGFEYVY